MLVEYYVRSDRKSLLTLAKRLMICQEQFDFNGGSTLHFVIEEDRVRWIKGTLAYLERKCKNQSTVYEVETYKK